MFFFSSSFNINLILQYLSLDSHMMGMNWSRPPFHDPVTIYCSVDRFLPLILPHPSSWTGDNACTITSSCFATTCIIWLYGCINLFSILFISILMIVRFYNHKPMVYRLQFWIPGKFLWICEYYFLLYDYQFDIYAHRYNIIIFSYDACDRRANMLKQRAKEQNQMLFRRKQQLWMHQEREKVSQHYS